MLNAERHLLFPPFFSLSYAITTDPENICFAVVTALSSCPSFMY